MKWIIFFALLSSAIILHTNYQTLVLGFAVGGTGNGTATQAATPATTSTSSAKLVMIAS